MSGARAYLLLAGAILLLLAALGALLAARPPDRLFSADPTQAALHAALGIAALATGLLAPARRPAHAMALAIVLLALAVVGTLTPRLFGYPARMGSALRWEVGENAAHLMLGAWGAYVATRETQD